VYYFRKPGAISRIGEKSRQENAMFLEISSIGRRSSIMNTWVFELEATYTEYHTKIPTLGVVGR
jgi:hypothetical protein